MKRLDYNINIFGFSIALMYRVSDSWFYLISPFKFGYIIWVFHNTYKWIVTLSPFSTEILRIPAKQAQRLGIRNDSFTIEMDIIPAVYTLDFIFITQPMSINDLNLIGTIQAKDIHSHHYIFSTFDKFTHMF